MKRMMALLVTLATGLGLIGCSTTAASGERTVQVFAAASLTKTFTELGAQFEAANPGTKVVFNFDGSSVLVDQLKGGAKADVFASADENNMTKAVDAQITNGSQTIFATNVLTLVVAPGNPKGITGLDDTLDGQKLVVCAPEVPCGNATNQLAAKLGVTLEPVSQESKVTDVLGKVTSGEADAGIVYATDAKGAADKVAAVAIEDSAQVVNNYPITVLAGAPQPELAVAFVQLVTSQSGKDVLTAAGFGTL